MLVINSQLTSLNVSARRSHTEWAGSRRGFTCDGGFHLKHAFLLPEDGGTLVDDPQGRLLLQPTLLYQMGLEHLQTGPPVHVQLFDRQAVSRRIRHGCREIKERRDTVTL